MNSYLLGLYEKAMPSALSWREKLEAARQGGFDYVELSVDESDEKLARLEMSGRQRVELLEEMDRAGIRLESMCLSGHRRFPLGSMDPQVRAESLRIMEQAILLARDLGLRVIQLAGYDVYYEPSTPQTEAYFAENLARSVELAEKYGVPLAFETMETPFINTVGKAMAWVRRMDSPYLLVYPDVGNITALSEGGDALGDLASGAGAIAAIHLKETVPGRFREIPYGTGHVDFSGMIQTGWKLGVRRYLAEFWYTGGDSWRQDLAAASGFLRGKFLSQTA